MTRAKQKVSGGDITLDDSGTEYYDTIFALAESPITKGLLWVGTDDGLIQITQGRRQNLDQHHAERDAGVEPHQPDRCFAVRCWHGLRGSRSPSVRRSAVLTFIRPAITGRRWTKLGQGIPDTTFVRAVREDPKKRGLLYAGTETGRLRFVQ